MRFKIYDTEENKTYELPIKLKRKKQDFFVRSDGTIFVGFYDDDDPQHNTTEIKASIGVGSTQERYKILLRSTVTCDDTEDYIYEGDKVYVFCGGEAYVGLVWSHPEHGWIVDVGDQYIPLEGDTISKVEK